MDSCRLTEIEIQQMAKMSQEYGYCHSNEWMIEELIYAKGIEGAWLALEEERDAMSNPEIF